MPRFAIGDLTVDLEVPERFVCEYALNGALVALDKRSGAKAEISGILINGDGVQAVKKRAEEHTIALHESAAGFASFFQPPRTWFAGLGQHLIIATLTKPEAFAEFAQVLKSVAPAHDPFPADKETSVVDLRPSHTRWFEQRRTSLLDAISWSAERHDAAERLDAFWADLVENPPEDEHLLNTMLSGAAVAFGDLLKRQGFEWCVAKDPWGVSIAVVALRGTANMVVVPDSFLSKRWQAREPRFVVSALGQIGEHVKKMKAEWKGN